MTEKGCENRPHMGDLRSVSEMRMSMWAGRQSTLAIDKFLANDKAVIDS